MASPARAPRGGPPRTATVTRTEHLSPSMVRVVFGGPDVAALPDDLFADAYVKLVFDEVNRAYTVRRLADGELWIDFVVHGDQGLAGPWAASASPGDSLPFVGPGGEWSPRASADVHLFVGDESALPAIASGLEALLAAKPEAKAQVYAEISGAGDEYPLPAGPGVEVTWVHRGDAAYGQLLTAEVLRAPYPEGDIEAFVHGNADMVRPLRRYFLRDKGLERGKLSISGYWRAGLTDEAWRAEKREFNALMEAEAGA